MEACPQHHFFDDALNTCRPCSDVCHQAEVRNTVELCRQKCPALLSSSTSSVESVDPPSTNNTDTIVVFVIVAVVLIITGIALFHLIRYKTGRRSLTTREYFNVAANATASAILEEAASRASR